MDFGKKILNKYGWKEGDGLGKNNDGIAKPLRANLKFDNAGLGADQAASDFNNHWWERVFNEAAGNVDVKTRSNGVCMNLKNPEKTVEITTKGYSLSKLKKKLKDNCTEETQSYDNFLKSGTITKAGSTIENPDKITPEKIEFQKFKQLTDEELFKACGGRTAHKGARHGLKLSGKLKRLEMQEKELLDKMMEQKKQKEEKAVYTTQEDDKLKRKIEKRRTKDLLTLVSSDLLEKTQVKCLSEKEDQSNDLDSEKSRIENGSEDECNLPKNRKKKLLKKNGEDNKKNDNENDSEKSNSHSKTDILKRSKIQSSKKGSKNDEEYVEMEFVATEKTTTKSKAAKQAQNTYNVEGKSKKRKTQ